MTAWTRKSIKSHQIPAMQMFIQAEEGTSDWAEAGDACVDVGFYDEAVYAYRMAGYPKSLINEITGWMLEDG